MPCARLGVKQARFPRRGAAVAGTALLCLASLGLPALAGAVQRAALRRATLARPAVAGTLDETARACPVVYDLWRAGDVRAEPALLAGDAAGRAAAEAGSRLAAFEEAGLLPPAAGEAARALLAGYTHDGCVWAGEAGAFHTVQVMQGENFLQLTWHESGAPVAFVLYAPGAGQGARPAAMLAAWKDTLGVDALPDWEEEPAGEDGAAATSASAELGLYVTAGKDRLELALRPAKEEANGRGNAAE
ncbi:MAG TPA: hypothetical protein H9945_02255 [Candidatus Gemmiger avicola]|uniref:Uncharacterized protein n=1 Tax=Candidatus Gemmiger avicola TaxID=2838605 RepID=A0A9D2S2T7_9FIRM|nr:hypothetical protein [Candidatus Gemmiger avicola]